MAGSPLLDLWDNLRAGAAMAVGRRVAPDRFTPTLHQVVGLSLLFVGVVALVEVLATDPPRGFDLYGLTILAAYLIAVLAGVYVVSLLQQATWTFRAIAVAVLAAALLPRLAASLGLVAWWRLPAPYDGYLADAAGWIVGTWGLLIGYRVTRDLLGIGKVRGLALGAILAGIVAAPHVWAPDPRVWYVVEPEPEAPARPDVETAYYAQPALVADRVAALRPGRPGVTDLYFLGYAGYAHQDVFMREVRSAKGLFDTSFDTTGRSLQLVNNPATLDEVPMANLPNLRAALAGIGAAMDRDDDVLFLYLTSHGDTDRLSSEFWPFDLNDLHGTDIAAALDDAGIQWRVVVISACYSGSFIEALRGPRTLVVTAARADRNSFGCEHKAAYTYFGEAYLDEALRRTRSFIDAYEMARATIAARELAEGLTPSEPQIDIGEAIRDKLDELSERLAAGR